MSDIDIYAQQGWGQPSGFGPAPALIIIDFVNGFTDPAQFGGGNINVAVEHTRSLLATCRQHGVPVCFTRIVYPENNANPGVFQLKAPALSALTETAYASQVVDALSPLDNEYVIRKTQPSAFFHTDLSAWLTFKGIDTVLIAGCTTSGCVRATVVDAMSHNYRTVVVTDCVGDRAAGPHEANLFDMGQKYADLMTLEQVLAKLNDGITTPT